MKYSLQKDKNTGLIKTSLLEKIKKNSIKICLDLTAIIGVSTIIWSAVKLEQCEAQIQKQTNNEQITNDLNDVESFIEKLTKKNILDLSDNEKKLLEKYSLYKKLSTKNDLDNKIDTTKTKQITKSNKKIVKENDKVENNIIKQEENNYLDYSDYFELINDIGINSQEAEERLTDDLVECFNDSCSKRGVDPEILIAMGKQENSLLNKTTGSAYGMMQIESVNRNNSYNTENFITNEKEYVKFSNMDLKNVKDNIDASAIMFQELIARYNNNINIAIHAYNYGYPIIDKMINRVMREKNISKEQVTYNDIKDYLKDLHKNPGKYLSNWGNSTYGDGNYVKNVTQRMRKRLVYAIYIENDNKILSIYDVSTGESIKKYISNGLKSNIYFDKEHKKYYKFEDIINSINPNEKSKIY